MINEHCEKEPKFEKVRLHLGTLRSAGNYNCLCTYIATEKKYLEREHRFGMQQKTGYLNLV